MTRKTYYIVISIIFVLFVVQHIFIKQPDILSKINAADDFSGVLIDVLDNDIDEPIGYYQGKKRVVLIFWASNSNPCQLVLDDIGTKIDKWNEKFDFEMIAVNVGESESDVKRIKELWDINIKIGLDPDQKIARDFGVGKLPTTIILNVDGSIKRRLDRYDPEITDRIRYHLDDDIDVIIDSSGLGETTTIINKSDDSTNVDSILRVIEKESE
jgi:thiol-disulfide isomerase/thioredoxin